NLLFFIAPKKRTRIPCALRWPQPAGRPALCVPARARPGLASRRFGPTGQHSRAPQNLRHVSTTQKGFRPSAKVLASPRDVVVRSRPSSSPLARRRPPRRRKMEPKVKASARGANGKVVTVYTKYVKNQNNTAVSITQPYQQLMSTPVGGNDDIDKRAAAFILAVRERFNNENK
ncbi:hypothetical protein U9M48_016674, partial [Paspalum notatum var. saurae]